MTRRFATSSGGGLRAAGASSGSTARALRYALQRLSLVHDDGPESERALERSIAILEGLHRESPGNAPVQAILAFDYYDRAVDLSRSITSRPEEAISWAQKALDIIKPLKEQDLGFQAMLHRFLCVQLQTVNRIADATRHGRESFEIIKCSLQR